MDFWLVDTKSTVVVDGKDVAFDWINTYFSKDDAIKNAKLISLDENTLQVSVHTWCLKKNGEQEIYEDKRGCIYNFLNRNHREMKK